MTLMVTSCLSGRCPTIMNAQTSEMSAGALKFSSTYGKGFDSVVTRTGLRPNYSGFAFAASPILIAAHVASQRVVLAEYPQRKIQAESCKKIASAVTHSRSQRKCPGNNV